MFYSGRISGRDCDEPFLMEKLKGLERSFSTLPQPAETQGSISIAQQNKKTLQEKACLFVHTFDSYQFSWGYAHGSRTICQEYMEELGKKVLGICKKVGDDADK